MKEASDKVYQACDICASSDRTHHSKKISLSHINEEFTEEIQADKTVVHINGNKHFVVNVVDIGTRYSERMIEESCNAEKMMELIENEGYLITDVQRDLEQNGDI